MRNRAMLSVVLLMGLAACSAESSASTQADAAQSPDEKKIADLYEDVVQRLGETYGLDPSARRWSMDDEHVWDRFSQAVVRDWAAFQKVQKSRKDRGLWVTDYNPGVGLKFTRANYSMWRSEHPR